MEHNSTVGSLDLMHDIIVPPAISFWPLAPGWYALALILLAYVLHLALKLWTKYRENAYRREALDELESYKFMSGKDTKILLLTHTEIDREKMSKFCHDYTLRLLLLAKRVGISAFGRKPVATLSNNSWWDFMEEHSKVKVDVELRDILSKILYDTSYRIDSNRQFITETRELVIVWIKTHEVFDD